MFRSFVSTGVVVSVRRAVRVALQQRWTYSYSPARYSRASVNWRYPSLLCCVVLVVRVIVRRVACACSWICHFRCSSPLTSARLMTDQGSAPARACAAAVGCCSRPSFTIHYINRVCTESQYRQLSHAETQSLAHHGLSPRCRHPSGRDPPNRTHQPVAQHRARREPIYRRIRERACPHGAFAIRRHPFRYR